jgi:hypothetical protein
MQKSLTEKNIPELIIQSPYSPDPTPKEFSLFPTPKMGKGTHFATMEDIKSNVTAKI